MEGTLFIYDEHRRLVAFESGCVDSETSLVFIGGMTDGLLSYPFLRPLADILQDSFHTSTIQLLLSSSYRQFGISSLQGDSAEIHSLLQCLATQRGKKGVILFGHSTGCQDILCYLHQHPEPALPIQAIILHGGISDRDYLRSALPDWETSLQWAEGRCRADAQLELFPRLLLGTPFTAYRLRSLLAPQGDDDYFSADLPLEYVRERLAIITMPALVLFSGQDEYVPSRDVYERLFTAYQDACTSLLKFSVIEGANHAMAGDAAQSSLLDTITSFLRSIHV